MGTFVIYVLLQVSMIISDQHELSHSLVVNNQIFKM